MLTCRQITELITEYLEGRMVGGPHALFQRHLGRCRHCRAYLHQVRATVEALGGLPTEPMPQAVRGQLRHRFRHWHRSG